MKAKVVKKGAQSRTKAIEQQNQVVLKKAQSHIDSSPKLQENRSEEKSHSNEHKPELSSPKSKTLIEIKDDSEEDSCDSPLEPRKSKR